MKEGQLQGNSEGARGTPAPFPACAGEPSSVGACRFVLPPPMLIRAPISTRKKMLKIRKVILELIFKARHIYLPDNHERLSDQGEQNSK